MESVDIADTIPKRLKYWSEYRPDKEAFVFVGKNGPRTALTCKELNDQCLKFGQNLLKLGVEAGSVICSLIPDSPENIVAFFGSHCAGCAVQNGTICLADGTFLLENLNKTRCRAIVLSSDSQDAANKILTRHFDTISGSRVSSKKLPYLTTVIFTRPTKHPEVIGFDWKDGIEDVLEYHEAKVTPQTDAVLLVTSGTTGPSKLIILPQFNLLYLGYTIVHPLPPLEDNDSIFDPIPISWGWGLPAWYLKTGHCRVMVDRRYPLGDNEYQFFRDVIVQESCRYAKMSVFACFQIAEINRRFSVNPNQEKWPLEYVLVAGQPLKKNILEIIGPVAKTVFNVYGGSEFGCLSTKTIVADSQFQDYNTGRIYSDIEVRIVNDAGNPVPKGEYGEILIKTPGFFSGYFGDKALTKQCYTDDGFFKSNDYGCFSNEYELIVQGRGSDVIQRGGQKYHPSWIEGIIRQCPGVSDCVIVNVPDKLLLNEICACVVPGKDSAIDEEIVREFCREMFLHHHSDGKTAFPKYYMIMESLPVNENGKFLRRKMKDIAAKHFNLV